MATPAPSTRPADDRVADVRVAYVVGTGRSGSTLLARMLGEVDGCFAAGEIRYLFARGLVARRACSCGHQLADCPRWRAVLEEAYGSFAAVPVERALRLLDATTRIRTLPRLARERLGRATSPELAELRSMLAPLYRAIGTVSGARIVVDSSKLPAYLAVLAGVEGLDVRTVHLVRDPRAAAFSWQRAKELTDGGQQSTMERIPPAKSAALWLGWNALTDLGGRRARDRYVRVRYEDLVAAPGPTLRTILAMLGEGGADAGFLHGAAADLGPSHLVAGNPDRMRTGAVTLRADDEWRTAMRSSDRMVVAAGTWPLRRRYGYH
jgi:hypothetical protein